MDEFPLDDFSVGDFLRLFDSEAFDTQIGETEELSHTMEPTVLQFNEAAAAKEPGSVQIEKMNS